MKDTMTTPAPAPAPAADVPGKTLGIVGLILAFLAAPIGFIISLVARSQSKKAGVKNTPATAGIIIGLIITLIWIIVVIVSIVIGASVAGGLAEACAELGSGTHEVGGVTYTCP
jgi:hypothetical protein